MIVFVHLLNDRSGSPRVLCSAINALAENVDGSRLFVGSDGSGSLNEVGVPITLYWYKRTSYRLLTLFNYLFSQLSLLVSLLRSRDIERGSIVYVNTLLPFGAALYGWLTGRKIIYHVHEISISPAPLRWFLVGMAKLTSSLNIYVSDSHMNALPIHNVPAVRIYNALGSDFAAEAAASAYALRRQGFFNILMIASLRDYKGIPELVDLSQRLLANDSIRVRLVVNDESEDIERYFIKTFLPPNLSVHAKVKDPAVYYAKAALVLNLSRVDQWVETFGLTVLEAMAFGIPVIAPPIGGPAELMIDGVQGFLVDSRDSAELERKVLEIFGDSELSEKMSSACRSRAAEFSAESFAKNIREAVAEVMDQ